MSEVSPEPWDEIERQYAGGVALSAIAKAFNVSSGRVQRKADRAGWGPSRQEDGGVIRQAVARIGAVGCLSGRGARGTISMTFARTLTGSFVAKPRGSSKAFCPMMRRNDCHSRRNCLLSSRMMPTR